MNTMQANIHPTKTAAIEALARQLTLTIGECMKKNGRCSLALAGGSTPKDLYRRLAEVDYATRIAWEDLHIFWSDERCVPVKDPDNNYRMAWGSLLAHMPIPKDNIHAVNVEALPEDAAKAYANLLDDEPIDIVLLGLGEDGHTASLFPGGDELKSKASATASLSPKEPAGRVTMTLDTINSALHVFFLVCGAEKAQVAQKVQNQLDGPIKRTTLPAARVRPETGPALWFCDEAAPGS